MPLENNKQPHFGIIILAAGGSSRLGRPKQLLPYQHQSLLQHSLQTANESGASEIVVVLGAYAKEIKKEITFAHGQVVLNRSWQEGIASSIRCGIHALLEISPTVEGAILMVCDQPQVHAKLLHELFTVHRTTGKTIVACEYENTVGTPVFFHSRFFPMLLLLQGDAGAKKLIRMYADQVSVIPFSGGEIDIDTEEDYRNIQAADQ